MPQYRTIPSDAECYSSVAKPSEKVFCVTIEEMALCGMSINTLTAYLTAHRNGKRLGWSHHKEGKSLYIHYPGLKDTYQNLIRATLLDGQSVDEWYTLNGRLNDLQNLFKQRLNDVFATAMFKKEDTFLKEFIYDDGSAIPVDTLKRYRQSLQWLIFLIRSKNKPELKAMGYASAKSFYEDVVFVMRKTGVKLPLAYPRLQGKIRDFEKAGASCLIDNRVGNECALKITEEAGNWLIARMASPMKRYTLSSLLDAFNLEAPNRGWKVIKSTEALRLFLYRPDIQPKWYGARYGELKSKEKYTRINKLNNASCRDALWYSDGTKLNLYYLDENGKMATCQVYEVMDAYSEVFLGYHFSDTEDFEAQYNAFKMAVKTSGHKPYEVKFDNQGGHKNGEATSFFKNISDHAVRTQPYNGKSKTIENAFGRLQKQFMTDMWFFTGQNITATKEQSRANMEFILDPHNKKRLPSLEEAKKAYLECRRNWNNAKHPKTGISRTEMYKTSVNPKSKAVDILDMVEMFWMFTPKPVTFTAAGLTIQVSKQKYTYEVFDDQGNPSKDFYRDNIGRKFYVAYDLDMMDYAKFYVKDANGSLKFYADAGTFLTANRALQDQTKEDLHLLRSMENQNKELRKERMAETEEIMRQEGVHPEQMGLKMPKLKGVERKKPKPKKEPVLEVTTIGEYEKETSNKTYDDYINERFNNV